MLNPNKRTPNTRKIVVGFDGREVSRDALWLGRELAAVECAQLYVAAAIDYAPLPISVDVSERVLADDFDRLRRHGSARRT